MERLSFSDSDRWSFIGQGWQTQGDGGEELTARPPWKVGLETYVGQECANDDLHLALRTDRAYGDFEARFKFRWDAGHCGAGFVFRVRDARH